MPKSNVRGTRTAPAVLVLPLVLALLAGSVAGWLAGAAPARAASVPPAAAAGSRFLAHEFTRLGYTYPSPTSPGNPDGGLTADAILALATTGGQDATAAKATGALRKAYFNANLVISGSVAKYLLVAEREGVDPHAWGTDSAGRGIDLVARLESTRNQAGRFTNTGQSSDLSNVFSQSLALIALHEYYAKHGGGSAAAERSAVAYLVRQQCPSGGFRPAPSPGDDARPCAGADDANVSVDYTAMAVWALASLHAEPDAVGRAVRWLKARQDPGGGFGAVSTSAATIHDTVNANSTGLAAQALAAAGDRSTASRANGWLAGLQLPSSVRPAAMAGALVYGPGDLQQVRSDPDAYWARSSNQDRLRRATAQAVLGLAAARASGGGPARPPSHHPTHRPTHAPTHRSDGGPTARPQPTGPGATAPGPGAQGGGSGQDPSRTSSDPGPSSTVAPAVATDSASPGADPGDGGGGGATVAAAATAPTGWRGFVGGPGGLTCAILLGLALATATYRRFSRAGSS